MPYKPGADGLDTITGLSSSRTGSTDTNSSGGFASVGSFSTLQMAADGSYTYTRAEWRSRATSTRSFVYTYRDGDGDLASATLTINIRGRGSAARRTAGCAARRRRRSRAANPGGTGRCQSRARPT